MKAKDIADLLYHYFIQNSSLSLPGIGTFDMFRISAQTDFANKKILPPTFTISYNYIHDSPKKELFDFISRKKSIPEWEAIKLVNDFSADLKSTLHAGEPFVWEGIGLLKQGRGKDIVFEPHRLSYAFLPHVNAQRVIRNTANHAMLVGDRERSKSEMQEFLSADAAEISVKGGWWSIAAMIAAVAVILLSVRAFTGGINIFSGLRQNIHAVDAKSTYTLQKQ